MAAAARHHALSLIDQTPLPGWRTNLLRSGGEGRPPADPRDLALAERIHIGVLKHLGTLRWLVAAHAGRDLSSIEPRLQKVLCAAIYEIRHNDRTPPQVSAFQWVSLVRRIGLAERAAGFVNAVLRRGVARVDLRVTGWRDAAERAWLLHSCPRPLWERLVALLGLEQALAQAAQMNHEPPTIARLLPGRSPDDVNASGVEALAHDRPGFVVLQRVTRAQIAGLAHDRIAQVQDPTSADLIAPLDVASHHRVLDRCCGRGTKTMQLLDRVGADSFAPIVAMDISARRIESLRQIAERRRVADRLRVHVAARVDDLPEEDRCFDRVLIDAPCSNSGVLARRAEARYHQTDRDLAGLVQLQRDILRDTARAVAAGGRLLYATCSIWPSENQRQVADFTRENPRFELIEQHTTLPKLTDSSTAWHDGGYRALLRRR